MNCELEANENGVFLVFQNEYEAEKALPLLSPNYLCITCFNGYFNVVKIGYSFSELSKNENLY